jgi:hypothetical protein
MRQRSNNLVQQGCKHQTVACACRVALAWVQDCHEHESPCYNRRIDGPTLSRGYIEGKKVVTRVAIVSFVYRYFFRDPGI